jgi:hypothetical protein
MLKPFSYTAYARRRTRVDESSMLLPYLETTLEATADDPRNSLTDANFFREVSVILWIVCLVSKSLLWFPA